MTNKDDYYQMAVSARYIAEASMDPEKYERAAELFIEVGMFAEAKYMLDRAQYYRGILEGEAE